MKGVLDLLCFWRRKRRKIQISIQPPRVRKVLSYGIEPENSEENEIKYCPSMNRPKIASEDCSSIQMGDEIEHKETETEGIEKTIGRIREKFIDKIPREDRNEFDPGREDREEMDLRACR